LKLVKYLLPLLLVTSLQAQVAITYPGLSDSLDVTLNKIVLPGQIEEVINIFISKGLASTTTGKWNIAIIDSMSFEEGVVLEDIGEWGWPSGFEYTGYPFKDGKAAKPKFMKYTKFTIDKGSLAVSRFNGERNNPPRGFLESTFHSNTFPTKSNAEERRENKRKEKK